MPNPTTFDEAKAAVEEMFMNEPPAEDTPPTDDEQTPPAEDTPNLFDEPTVAEPTSEEPPVEVPTETPVEPPVAQTPPAEDQSAVGQAAQMAETAAQLASQKDSELQQALAAIEALKQQNQQLQGTLDEISRQNTENVLEEALEPPTIDLNSLAFADEETQKAELAKFADGLSAYNRKQMMAEMSPVLEFAKKGMRDAETRDVMSVLSNIPELKGIDQMLPQLEGVIANNKWLQSDDMPLDEKYINAFAIMKGIDSINNPHIPEEPKEPTPEELLQMYNNNSAFQELVEKQRLGAIKQSQQVPPMSASSGAVNAALNIKEKPKTLEDASRRTREMFGEM